MQGCCSNFRTPIEQLSLKIDTEKPKNRHTFFIQRTQENIKIFAKKPLYIYIIRIYIYNRGCCS